MLAPGARGVGNANVDPAVRLLLSAPPNGWLGGVSSVVPNTVTVQGWLLGVPVAAHVAESLIPLTVTFVEFNTLKSAIGFDTGRLLISTTRNRKCVTGAPVLFTNRRLIDI